MDPWLVKNKKAAIQSLVVFTALFGAVLLLTIYYDFTGVDLGGLLFLVSFLSCIFIAKNIFDVKKSSVAAERFKKSVAVDLAVSSDDLYVQLYKNSPVPYLILDASGKVKSANTAAVRTFGTTQQKIKGINVFTWLKGEDTDHMDFVINKYKSGVSVSDEMVKIVRKDKRETWALLSLFVTGHVDGQEIGLLTLVDITRQKKAEDAKSEFVSLASHQLRTPIAGMKWSAELLQMDSPESLTPNQNKYVERLLISVRRMAVLVDDFLRVSRFDLGTFQAENKKISLSKIFKAVLTEQSAKAESKGLVVKTFFAEDIDEVMSDPNLIRMVVTNLYSNAIKYTRDKGTVHIGFGVKDDDILITVADNGMGIPAEDQEGIFSKLFRASNAVRDVPDGTGLGLYIVREAVAVLKGNVSFTTTENIGTTFEVVLPLVVSDQD